MNQDPILPDEPEEDPLAHVLRLHGGGDRDGAELLCTKILEDDPKNHHAAFLLGIILHQSGRFTEAIQAYLKAIDEQPGVAQYYIALAESLKEQGSTDDAIDCLQAVLRLDPGNADALNGIGDVCLRTREFETAIKAFERAIERDPEYCEAHGNLGGALAKTGAFERSIESSLTALRINDRYVPAYNNLAFVAVRQKKFDDAVGFYEEALRLDPDDAYLHFHLSIALLAAGLYERGWEEFEWRLRKADYVRMNARAREPRLWSGETLAGKTVLVWSEQGIGDTLQFIRFLPLLRAQVGAIFLECPREVLSLLHNFPGIDRLLPRPVDAAIEFDVHLPLLSLPKYLGTTLAAVPSHVPYLEAPRESIEKFAPVISHDAFTIGIVWSGGTAFQENASRSCALTDFYSLLETGGAVFYSLQKGEAESQIADLPASSALTPLGGLFETFADTAGALHHLDLVITVDTSVAHLAGAMGKTVWLLSMHAPDWRWYAAETWYPTMRTFLQPSPGDWTSVLDAVKHELQTLLKTP